MLVFCVYFYFKKSFKIKFLFFSSNPEVVFSSMMPLPISLMFVSLTIKLAQGEAG